ncbi:MAG: tyrosine-type recombinase/integrase [Chloroflexi bacterium]|nr:tyrosine-type recombinase/integrase [Chloroflexota bacterium]
MGKNLKLDEGITEFEKHLARRPLSDNTRKAFLGDARIFARFLQSDPGTGSEQPVSLTSINAEHIKAFLTHQERSGIANSPKSIERRLTSLKVFFRWVHEAGYLAHDPADGVAYKPFLDPLPEYLTDEQADAIIKAAHQVAAGDRLEMRPLTAIMLVLETGIKKGECLALTVSDVERGETGAASVWIRYEKRHLQFKDRKLPISDECLQVVDSHIERYESKGMLFDCTGRNLEYMFNRKVAPLADLEALTFEMLRWTCAVRDYRAGALSSNQLQVKYGLSPIGWTEMEAKLARLTHPAYNGTVNNETD